MNAPKSNLLDDDPQDLSSSEALKRHSSDQKSQINSELEMLARKLVELHGSKNENLIQTYKEMVLERIKRLNNF